MKIYENIVLGDGPVGRFLTYEILRQKGECLTLDAGSGLKELKRRININSNIAYTAKDVAPSFDPDGSDFMWAGGCQGWPLEDFGQVGEKLPVDPNSDDYKIAMRVVNKNLKILNFNFYSNLPRLGIWKKGRMENQEIYKIFCKTIKDPSIRSLHEKSGKYSKLERKYGITINRISKTEDFVEVIGMNIATKEPIAYKCKRLHLCLGTIENTRILLASQVELGFEEQNFLGKYLSDHLALKFLKLHTKNLPKVIREFSRPRTLDGNRLWPRLRSLNPEYKYLTRSFVHLDHFTFDGKIPIIFRILRRIGKENFYFARKRSGSFDLNIFTEKTNAVSNEIRLSNSNEFNEYLDIDFYVNSSEIEQLKFCGEYWSKVIFDFLGNDFQKKQYLFNDNDIQSKIHAGSHPSGTYRMSSNANSGIVNEKSELWQDNRIRVLGSGVYPIASVTHPTYTSLILALLGVSSDTSSI